jgi:hypothetical protein
MKCPYCNVDLKESKYGLFLECEKGHFAIEESAIKKWESENNVLFK